MGKALGIGESKHMDAGRADSNLAKGLLGVTATAVVGLGVRHLVSLPGFWVPCSYCII